MQQQHSHTNMTHQQQLMQQTHLQQQQLQQQRYAAAQSQQMPQQMMVAGSIGTPQQQLSGPQLPGAVPSHPTMYSQGIHSQQQMLHQQQQANQMLPAGQGIPNTHLQYMQQQVQQQHVMMTGQPQQLPQQNLMGTPPNQMISGNVSSHMLSVGPGQHHSQHMIPGQPSQMNVQSEAVFFS